MPIGDVQTLRFIMYKEREEYSRLEKEKEQAKKKMAENKAANKPEDDGIEPILSMFPLPEPSPFSNGGLLGGLFG